MTAERRNYTEEFKREAVRLMESSGKPIAQLARELGINDNNLYRWRRVYSNQPLPSMNGSQASRVELEAEVKHLRREMEVLRQERDILKKAMSIVSRSQP
jgi:transposase